MTNKKLISLNVKDFKTGKIIRWKDTVYAWRDFIFLFDIYKPALVQLSAGHDVLGRWDLKTVAENIRSIDAVYFNGTFILIADSQSHNLYRLNIDFDKNGTLAIGNCEELPLKSRAVVRAIVDLGSKPDGRICLLDKNNCLIRIVDNDLKEITTVGSRMGYLDVYAVEGNRRLGFEFPEDMVVTEDRILISDSGNKRLVVLKKDFSLEKAIVLPEYPFRIIFYDGDRVVLSDFDRSLLYISLTYGYIFTETLDYPVDFYASYCYGADALVGSEETGIPGDNTDGADVVELSLDKGSVENDARQAKCLSVLVRIMIDDGRLAEARELVLAHEELLPVFARYTSEVQADEQVISKLKDFLESFLHNTLEQNGAIKEEIKKQSYDFITLYNTIPGSTDKEAANIEKENILRQMFLGIKKFRENLVRAADMGLVFKRYPLLLQRFKEFVELRADSINGTIKVAETGIFSILETIESHIPDGEMTELIGTITDYWFSTEEAASILQREEIKRNGLFKDKFLLEIYKNVNYFISLLYLKQGNVDQYIRFIDREISMYPDKMDIFAQFINKLSGMKRYDDILRMLDKFPSRNKENINYYYYNVYRARQDLDMAFAFLKKELDLYPHRHELIPLLLKLRKLSREEADLYISKLLDKAERGIDVFYNVAMAFEAIGDFEKASHYIDMELKYFPENQRALNFKLTHAVSSSDKETLRALVPQLPVDHPFLSGKVFYVLEDHEKSWGYIKVFLMDQLENPHIRIPFIYLTPLNYICDIDAVDLEIRDLLLLMDKAKDEDLKRELLIYLSFLSHEAGKTIGRDIEKFQPGTYLAAFSTGILAYNHFFERMKTLKEEEKWDELLSMAHIILKFNPGDKHIFDFLDNIAEIWN